MWRTRITRVLLALAVLVAAGVASTQTVTITEETLGPVKKITVAWTSDAGGDASDSTTRVYNGRVLALVTDPGATAPTDNYDIVVTDADGIDVLDANGANRDTATTEQVTDEALLGVVAGDVLTFTVSNAGDSKVGTIYLYIR